jgi:hypothetical protein
MPTPELDTTDPSVMFGQSQGLFAYRMASSLTGDSDRPIIERARDAVRVAAFRLEDGAGIDVELAVSGLIAALEGNYEVAETVE